MQYQHTLGRVLEYPAVKQWFQTSHQGKEQQQPRLLTPSEALSIGLDSVLEVRRYAVRNRRAPAPGSEKHDDGGGSRAYFWADHRADALGLATFNGIDVGRYDIDREPRRWRQALAVLDSKAGSEAAAAPAAAVAVEAKGKAKEVAVVVDDSDDDDDKGEGEGEVDATIEGLISGVGFVDDEDEDWVEGEGDWSSKRLRVQ